MRRDWLEFVTILVIVLFGTFLLSHTGNTPNKDTPQINIIKEANVSAGGLSTVFSFTYNDSYGIYHCIYFDGGYDGGLWCERLKNSTPTGGEDK